MIPNDNEEDNKIILYFIIFELSCKFINPLTADFNCRTKPTKRKKIVVRVFIDIRIIQWRVYIPHPLLTIILACGL